MTQHETTTSSEARPDKESFGSAKKFQETFLKHVARYATDPNYEDMCADIKELSLDDPQTLQLQLESGWPSDLDEIRLQALLEAHQQEMGVPSDENVENARSISRAELLKRDDIKTEQVHVLDVVSNPKQYDAEDIGVAIEYIEGQIVSESVLDNNPETLEALRTTRDELYQRQQEYLAEQSDKKTQTEITNLRATGDAINAKAAAGARSKIDEVFSQQEADSSSSVKVPTTQKELIVFEREVLSTIKSGEQISQNMAILKQYISNVLVNNMGSLDKNEAYSNTVASVFGQAGEAVLIMKIVYEARANEGKDLEWDDFLKTPFEDVAKTLGIDVREVTPDYDEYFKAPAHESPSTETKPAETDLDRDTTNEVEKSKKRELRNALDEGLGIINSIPQATREHLFSKHNLPNLMQTLDAISQKADLDKLNPQIVSHTKELLSQIGLNNPNSLVWGEIGRPSSSEVGRIAIRAEEALVPLLKHINKLLDKENS